MDIPYKQMAECAQVWTMFCFEDGSLFSYFQILMNVLPTMDTVDRFAQMLLGATLVHAIMVTH